MSAGEVYRKTRKTPDLFWNAYVCRPLAAVLVNLIKDTRITPNQITLASYWVALGAAALLIWLPGYWGLVIAVLCYQASYVLDCADGMLARWRNLQSTPGHLLDFLIDELKAFLILAAVAVRLYHHYDDERFLLLGLAGLILLASGVAMTTFERRPEIAPPKAPGEPAAPQATTLVSQLLAVPMRVAKLLIHYPSYITFAALSGYIEAYFFPYLLINAVYMLRSLAVVTLRFGRP